ncbi:GMC family oxidoreductase N-terminal domain-containing protein [uncultured Amphritea sp.]|uniref:GMC family oxidoreductase N-terminal domain-containing protein n=1 Tax=uncultured Amphritea sp. TaxID=981605 RepID=UPI00261DE7AC|nr:GMC family oxidoreductase N-terminal domain-containing protein [uncultured Amphritea sp.]
MKPIALPLDEIKPHYDVVVIGSGYGGGIAASRMARAGKRVCLLERGREILVGEFPDTANEVFKDIQFHTAAGHIGSRIGLFDIHVNEQQNVVVGCGLGGTSLINANVSLEPDPDVFEDDCWPPEILQHKDSFLKEGYQRAREMLKPTRYPDDWPALAKLEAHKTSAAAMNQPFCRTPINVTFHDTDSGLNHVGVEQQACTNCGDCVSGCNYGAKNTTRMNYLPDAWNHGAEIFCQTDVRYLQKTNTGWLINYQEVEVGREKFDATTLFIRADIVVVCAGTLGSNEILLRSRDQGLAMSGQLGKGFSGNGDILGFGYNCDQTINGIGFGNLPPTDRQPVGPCITSVIRTDETDWHQRMIIEEGSLPGAIGNFLPTALAAAADLIGEDTDSGVLDTLQEKARITDSMFRGPYHGAINNTQTYLIMSHDKGDGQAELINDRLRIRWPDVGQQENFAAGNNNLLKATAALGGKYVANPLWTPLFKQSLVTVHPLGGCNMAANGSLGVVNHKGQLFNGTGTSVYEDLYVSDGSVIPTSLAVNPLLTISAISERCCALIAADRGWSIDYTLPSAPVNPHPSKKLGLSFTESMKGRFSRVAAAEETLTTYKNAAINGSATPMEFLLTIHSHDLETMLHSEDHAAQISGTVTCPALSDKPLSVSEGNFNLFEQMPSPPDTRHMIYSMQLTSETGELFYFKGYKLIKNDPNALHIWADTSTLYVSVYKGVDASGPLAGKGILHIMPADFAVQMTTMEVTNAENVEERLKAIARFGKFFAGILYENYGGIFYDSHCATPKTPRKKRELRAPIPEIHPFTTDDGVHLLLTRYQGGTKGPVMLVHGLGVASSIFSTDMIDTNLVEYLVAHNYDVWLIDCRVSILLPAARQRSNGDQVANYDYPAAVNTILSHTGAASLQAVVHCYGATTFFMSMLAGLQGVRSIVCSQIATNLVVPATTALKTGLHLPSFLDRLNVNHLTAEVPESGSVLTQLYDKALGLYAMAEAQGRCHSETCHRITFMYASLYKHSTLNELLHDNLDELFAEANIGAFEHLALMCRKGTLVDADGHDVYMPNLARLDLPILFISGAENECYLPMSTKLTYDILCQHYGTGQYSREVIPGYGHIDCIFGKDAVIDVYPQMLEHLEKTALQ